MEQGGLFRRSLDIDEVLSVLSNSANLPSEFRKIATYNTNVVFRDRKAKQANMYDLAKD